MHGEDTARWPHISPLLSEQQPTITPTNVKAFSGQGLCRVSVSAQERMWVAGHSVDNGLTARFQMKLADNSLELPALGCLQSE